MAYTLGPQAAAAGFRLLSFQSVTSTNSEALAHSGEDKLWFVADEQTAGRGRRGRVWTSLPGNLFASLLLKAPAPPDRCAQLSFVAALAIHDAVAPAAARIKWPNDLLIDGRKFTGILIESAKDGATVIGIGVNCAHHPDGTEHPAGDLGGRFSREQVFSALSDAMVLRLAQWRGGFASIRADWLVRASGLGEEILVRLPNRTLSGHFDSLDESGRLMLRLPDGRLEPIAAGDVFPMAREKVSA